ADLHIESTLNHAWNGRPATPTVMRTAFRFPPLAEWLGPIKRRRGVLEPPACAAATASATAGGARTGGPPRPDTARRGAARRACSRPPWPAPGGRGGRVLAAHAVQRRGVAGMFVERPQQQVVEAVAEVVASVPGHAPLVVLA